MVFNTGAALLDAIVLAAVSREQQGTYGYIRCLAQVQGVNARLPEHSQVSAQTEFSV